MSRIVTTRIAPGDARSAASVNAQYTAIEAAANALDFTNFTEEGITRWVTGSEEPSDNAAHIDEDTRSGVTMVAAAWATAVFSGTTFRTGALSVLANEKLRIRARMTFESTVAAGLGLSSLDQVGIRLAYRAGGVTTVKTATVRRDLITASVTGLNHTRLRTQGLINGAIELEWVELQVEYVNAGGGGYACYPSKGLLDVQRFRRVT
jgi:hypothetical protein